MNKHTGTTKKISEKRILEAAERVFAEKGLEGSRVDEIAQKAGVNKALLYYYFKSKDELFRETIRQSLIEGYNLRDNLYAKPFSTSSADLGKRFQKAFSFIEEKKDIFRVLVMEAVKRGSDKNELFDLLDQLVFRKIFPCLTVEDDRHWKQTRRHLFYCVIVPFISFITLSESWNEYFGDHPEHVKKDFMHCLQETVVRLLGPEFPNRDMTQDIGTKEKPVKHS